MRLFWCSFFLFGGIGIALFSQCEVNPPCFDSKEKATYEVYYKWGFMWVSAGWVKFSATQSTYKDKQAFHLYSQGKSYPKWDWFYKVNDIYESYIHPNNFTPYYFSRQVEEKNDKYSETLAFSDDIVQVNKHIEGQTQSAKTITKKNPCAIDPITMIYKARSIPFETFEIGQKYALSLIIDGEEHQTFIRYQGKEVKSVKGKGKYNALKFSALLVEGTMFKGGEDLTVWVTDDKNRVPLVIQSEVLVGSINAVLSSFSGLKYPLTSKIE